MLGKLIAKVGGVDKLIGGIVNAADEFITTKEEKELLKLELEKLIYNDRADAREMYENNSSLQKVYAIAFLVFYTALTGALFFLVYSMVKKEFDMPDWAIAFISTMWGGMSAKVSTITDFLFGSSKGSQDKNLKLK